MRGLMGIRRMDIYIIECDICGEELENGDGGTLCSFSKEEADKYREMSEWIKKDGKIACPNCYEEI